MGTWHNSEADEVFEEQKYGVREKPKYSQYRLIALDMAAKIMKGQYGEGQLLYGRSTLASRYGVSSETARRALSLLAERGIVEIVKGRGVTVTSMHRAADFVREFRKVDIVLELRNALRESVSRQKAELERMEGVLDQFIDGAEKFRELGSFVPYQQLIAPGSPLIGQSLGSVRFWQHTHATVAAVRRDEQLMLSPGPGERLLEGDVIYFIGDPSCVENVRRFVEAQD